MYVFLKRVVYVMEAVMEALLLGAIGSDVRTGTLAMVLVCFG
jgi:hypothetical protein